MTLPALRRRIGCGGNDCGVARGILGTRSSEMGRLFALGISLLAMVVLIACGGSTTPTARSTTPSVGQTSAPVTTPGAPGQTQAPPVTAGPGATLSGGGGDTSAVPDPCALLTVTEVAGASRMPGDEQVTATPTFADPATCDYGTAEGSGVLNLYFQRKDGAVAYQYFVDQGTSDEPITGVGDSAAYVADGRVLFLVGDLYVSLTAGYAGSTQTHENSKAASIDLAKIVVARLTGAAIPPELQITAPPIVNAETACDLLSGDEAASILGKGAMTASGSESVPQFCSYALDSTGEVLVSTYFRSLDGIPFYTGLESSLDTDPVDGLADKAMFESSTGILYVLQRDTMFNVNVFGADLSKSLDKDRELAEIMLSHL